jgi:hypothetical protein
MTSTVKDMLSDKKLRKRKLNPEIIRVKDNVKIINPEIIIRVGYPMSFDDACREVDKLYRQEILEFLNKTIYKQEPTISGSLLETCEIKMDFVKPGMYMKIIKALAYNYIQMKSFGGREKKIYAEYRQELLGMTLSVENIFIRKTGIYFASSGGYDHYSGEYDFEPGGLDKIKTHKILELNYWLSNNQINDMWESRSVKIESCNVEKIHEKFS